MIDAKEYGNALFMITEEDGKTDKVLADVKTADCVLKENPDYVKLLSSPAISKEERVALADKAFSGLDESLVNLIKILIEKRNIGIYSKVATAYLELYDDSRGIVRVEAITAIPMDKTQIDRVKAKLEATLNKRVIINNRLDPSILGGMKLRYSGVQLDGSIKTRLDKFEEALKQTVI